MNNVDPESWDKNYREIFYGDPLKHEAQIRARKNISESIKGQEGFLNIEKKESKKVEVADMSQFLGRSPGSIAVPKDNVSKKPPLIIGPSDDGGLSVTSDT